MESRAAIAQYEATVVLVVISLSLVSIAYSGLRRETRMGPKPVFVNQETMIGGNIERVGVNSSSPTTISSFSLDEASSLCISGKTTLFSVDAKQAGTLRVATDGRAWVSGTWGAAVAVSPGWHEMIIEGGTTCSIVLPGGTVVPSVWNSSSRLVSSIPVEGASSGTTFTFYLPSGGGPHRLLITSAGGFDDVAL